ncbi:sensor histidine kinase [Roseburia sp. AM59-24XD]|jgi:two-component system sensor histidine kinase YesM|nr:sensor histidine kinase [Roseburia sp. AM59-24XD]
MRDGTRTGKYMKHRIGQWFKNAKIQKKIMIIYICIGTIPILLLGLFASGQERKTLMEREHRNIEDSVSQGASQLKSQILVYNNLSDYIAFNQPISDVLIGDYDNIFSMYEQYTATVDPVLSSLKYFNPNINQITIYLDKNIVKHDTMVDSLQTIEGEKWYRQNESSLSQKVKWIIDAENKTSFSARTMPIMEQNKQKGILYLDVNYDSLFAGFDDISRDSYGLYIVDKKGNVLFEKDTFSENTASKNNTKTTAKKSQEKRLSFPALKKKMEAQENGKKSNYLIVSADAGVDDWKIIVYQPQKMMAREIQTLLVLVMGIIAVCIITSVVASLAFSRFVVRDIKRLRDNMQAVEEGNMELMVTSDAGDEVGSLIRGFGSMLGEINRLIHEVYESKLTQRKSEMTALQAQINPHFLYNSLSLINWKALEAGQQDISKITLALSSFYRTSLNRGKNVLTIEKEIENMKSYLEIQLCMHDNDFDVIMDIDEEILPYQTLNLLLQPLVENAIDHGIDLKEDGRGYIKIIGRKDAENIYLTVEDNGVGIEPEILSSILEFKTKGYGVRNVNQRIRLYYGEEYCLRIESEVGKGTRCTINIPQKSNDPADGTS